MGKILRSTSALCLLNITIICTLTLTSNLLIAEGQSQTFNLPNIVISPSTTSDYTFAPFDDINFTLSYFYGSYPPWTEFGSLVRAGNTFSANVSTCIPHPDQAVLMIVHTDSHTYNLGRLSEGEYTFELCHYYVCYNEGLHHIQTISITVAYPPVHNINLDRYYNTIQEGINNASSEDTIVVDEGAYYENIIIDKPILLIGEDKYTTIIDGNGTGHTLEIQTHDATIRGFTIQNSGLETYTDNGEEWSDSGIFLSQAQLCKIGNNIVIDNLAGITLHNSSNNHLRYNTIANNSAGIMLSSGNGTITTHNTIKRNNIVSNGIGLSSINLTGSNDNYIFHNNFMDNDEQAMIYSTNYWDDGYPSGGNYWSDYNNPDLYRGFFQNMSGSDGIGDIPYLVEVDNQDRYPFMEPLELIPFGDMNFDGRVDIYDVMLAVAAYGSTPDSPNWNQGADLAPQYGVIDIFDLVTVAYHYGKTYF